VFQFIMFQMERSFHEVHAKSVSGDKTHFKMNVCKTCERKVNETESEANY